MARKWESCGLRLVLQVSSIVRKGSARVVDTVEPILNPKQLGKYITPRPT